MKVTTADPMTINSSGIMDSRNSVEQSSSSAARSMAITSAANGGNTQIDSHMLSPILARSLEKYQRWLSAIDMMLMTPTGCKPEQGKAALSALRNIRNKVIGNVNCKRLFVELGLLGRMMPILAISVPPYEGSAAGKAYTNNSSLASLPQLAELQLEAVVIIGSISYGFEDDIVALLRMEIPRILLDLLCRKISLSSLDGIPNGSITLTDGRLCEALCRTLRTIFRFSKSPRDLPFRRTYSQRIVGILAAVCLDQTSFSPSGLARGALMAVSPTPSCVSSFANMAEYVAIILANCCDSTEKQNTLMQMGVMDSLHRMLSNSSVVKIYEAALDLMAALTRDNKEASHAVASYRFFDGNSTPIVLFGMLTSPRPETRFLAAVCLTNLNRAGVIPELANQVKTILLDTLIKLIDEPGALRARAPLIIAYLISDNEALQSAAIETNTIAKLSQLLSDTTPGFAEQYQESALIAFASICSLKEECRRFVIEAKILPRVVAAMSSPAVGVRSAACQCTRSLSRSVKNLRTALVDAGVALPLLKLLRDESLAVQTTACASLCNVVLDFSPMKKIVLEEGGVERLIEMVQSMDSNLRLNALWALKNLLYQAETSVKSRIMRLLTFSTLDRLADDPEPLVQEQALNLLRNLACGKSEDIDEVFTGLGGARLVALVQAKLASTREETLIQTLYIVVNVATGSLQHKITIMRSQSILAHIYRLLSHQKSEVRVAAVWCIINLTWTDDEGSIERVVELRKQGFEDRLKALQSDNDVQVRDRVQTALAHFAPPEASSV